MSSSQFLAGSRRCLPVLVSAAPFGALFGAVAVDNGFTVGEAVLMSATVFAGASQMVGIELFGQNVAPWLIVLSIFAVNFRHVLYSAAIGKHFAFGAEWKRLVAFFLMTDPQFAESEAIVRRGEKLSFAWYLGLGLPLLVAWPVLAWLGATFGKLIENPHALGLDIVLAVYFFGMLLATRNRPLWLPVVAVSAIASIAAWFTIGSPWHVSAGAFAGVAVAAMLVKPEPAQAGPGLGNP
ncbi:MAG: AzlC family ABC transporter permease [Rhizobiaceae bacterium]|jgi:predicted branched-subunit amino acid permease|nr:AzlC family ABC transporter permease [Rhizobiaceae bacterium]